MIYRRVLSLTIMAKLVLKYSKAPEEFMVDETVKIAVKLIPKKLQAGRLEFDYRAPFWTNYDLFSLCYAISRHGFGEWEAILRDEVIWAMHLKNSEVLAEDDGLDDDENPKKPMKIPSPTISIYDVLVEKLCNQVELRSLKNSPSLVL
jgi:hypothetical protein